MKFESKKFIKCIGISSTLALLITTGCSNTDDVAFINSRVEDGMVILGSDPVIDNINKAQKEVKVATKRSVLKSVDDVDPDEDFTYQIDQKTGAKTSTSYRSKLRQNVDALNKKLLTSLTFDKNGKVNKTNISKKDINAFMDLYAMDMEKVLSDEQMKKLSRYVVGALNNKTEYQNALGDFYLDGFSGETYEQIAVSWYLIAAGKDSTYAKYMLSILYQLGLGLPQDLNESVAWYKKASESKNTDIAKVKVAKRYLKPTSVIYDPKQAFVWMESAAEQGNVEAQYLLADMYLQGKGVDRSDVAAIKWYGKAAEQNSAYAQYSLGVMYYNGQSVEQNLLEAQKWLKYAAFQNNTEAQYLLGRMYEQGFGVEKSLIKAYAWWQLISKDSLLAVNFDKKLGDIITGMNPEDRVEAKRLSAELKKQVAVS